ncbi:MAG: 3-hydroxyacyl-CoA dehydrogenase family protein [Candidatus Geothermarchaeales archaeon]
MRAEDVEKVAVIGFGLMGRQITQLCAQIGFSVVARDVSDEIMRVGLDVIQKGRFGLNRAVERGKITKEDAEKAISRIKTTKSMAEACRDADFVIEAVYEDLGLKKSVFRELDELCGEDVVLATNTSTLSITEIASATNRPAKVVGMHFLNPAQIMRLVEIVQGLLTSDETTELTRDLVLKLGKTPIIVRDSPGFATSRLGIALYLEASKMLEEGVASIRDIDIGMTLGYRHPMGPFELADLVGLDARLRNLEALYASTGDPKWRPPKILRQLVASGYLGNPKIKPGSKGGYYEYFKLIRPSEEEK